jgi:MFS family permease
VAVLRQAAESLRAFGRSFANPRLRRLQLAGIGSTIGTGAYAVAISVFAFHAGGARAVGLLFFARWGLAAALAPWLGFLADRWSRRLVMIASDLTRVLLVGGIAALVETHGSALAVYALAVASSVASSAFQPAQAALLPSLARTPEELASANVAMSTIGNVGFLAGPALGGVLLAAATTSVVFLVTVGALIWSVVCVAQLPSDRVERAESAEQALAASLVAGFRAIASEPPLRLIVGLTCAQTLVTGAFEVLLVVVALRLLHAGNAGVGWLNTAFGVGGVLGGVAAVALVGRKRLAADFGIGLLLWGIPIALIAAWANLGFALVFVGLAAIGGTITDVAGMTLLQRAADEEVLGRVFGVLESLIFLGLAIGAAITSALVGSIGIRPTLVAAGLLLPVCVLAAAGRLRALDATARAPAESLALLRSIAMFAALPPPVLERLASTATLVTAPAGGVVFSRGDPGVRFYAIESGGVAVELEGGETRELGAGDFFGEIALLRDVPRTATVRALDDLRLYALERDDFIAAVTGHAPSREAADSVVAARMPAGAAAL